MQRRHEGTSTRALRYPSSVSLHAAKGEVLLGSSIWRLGDQLQGTQGIAAVIGGEWHLIAALIQWVGAVEIGLPAWDNRILRAHRQPDPVCLRVWHPGTPRVCYRFAVAPFAN